MNGRRPAAVLLLFAVLFMHGLQCSAAGDAATHSTAGPAISLGLAAGVGGHPAQDQAVAGPSVGAPARTASSPALSRRTTREEEAVGFGMDMDMGWMWLFWLLLILGVVLLVVVAVRAFGGGVTKSDRGNGRMPQERSRARQVLDERYARGEITTEEYQERLRALGEDR